MDNVTKRCIYFSTEELEAMLGLAKKRLMDDANQCERPERRFHSVPMRGDDVGDAGQQGAVVRLRGVPS